MSNGIYGYVDKKINKIVYIGKDSYIDKGEAKKRHMKKSCYDAQPFNRILQNNPNRYEYIILEEGFFSEEKLNDLESFYIKKYGTFRLETNFGWNFTKGGDGTLGYHHKEETKKKIGDINRGRKKTQEEIQKIINNLPDISHNKHPFYGHKHTNESKQKISKKLSGKNNPNYNPSNDTCYVEIRKDGRKKNNKGFRYKSNGVDMSSKDFDKLVKKVKDKGLPLTYQEISNINKNCIDNNHKKQYTQYNEIRVHNINGKKRYDYNDGSGHKMSSRYLDRLIDRINELSWPLTKKIKGTYRKPYRVIKQGGSSFVVLSGDKKLMSSTDEVLINNVCIGLRCNLFSEDFVSKIASYNQSLKNSFNKRNTSGFLRVSKKKKKSYRQGFCWVYQYQKNGKRISIAAKTINKLQQKVEAQGFEWREI